MKLFTANSKALIYFYSEPVSMACGFPGLSQLIQEKLGEDPLSGNLYLFVNKKRNYLKVLFYHREGLCLFAKKLDAGVFEIQELPSKITVGEMSRVIDCVVTRKLLS